MATWFYVERTNGKVSFHQTKVSKSVGWVNKMIKTSMEKNLEYFKEREAQILNKRKQFKAIDVYWLKYEENPDNVSYRDFIRVLGSISALNVWDALTRGQQDELLRFYKDSLSKEDIVKEAIRINDEELNKLHREYSDWHFEKYGWVSYSF